MRLLWRVIRSTHTDYLVYALVVIILIVAGILTLVEPSLHTYGDSLWYCFSVVTTIGLGDVTVVTLIGRILSVLVGIFGILTVGVVIGVVVAYYNEFLKIRTNESLEMFADKLEHLPDLSHDELVQLSASVKERRDHMGRPMAGRERGTDAH